MSFTYTYDYDCEMYAYIYIYKYLKIKRNVGQTSTDIQIVVRSPVSYIRVLT